MRRFIILCVLSIPCLLLAQSGVGLRFGTWVNHFYRPDDYNLIQGTFSHAEIGAFYRYYKKTGGLEVGLSYLSKPQSGIPFVAQDFKGGHQTAYNAGQLTFLFGPQFDFFRPKTGYVAGIRTVPTGFIAPGIVQSPINTFYMALPVGFSLEFPTSFGTVGGSFFYQIGMTNVKKNPFPDSDPGFDGGKMRSLNFEIFVMYGSKKK
jgi:hypothetical protein